MANFYGSPWVLDTVGVVHPDGIARLPIRIKGVQFVGYSTGATDKAVFTDGTHTVIELDGASDKSPVSWTRFGGAPPFRGLTLATLTSGTVVVDVE